jgi:hypothetical protein
LWEVASDFLPDVLEPRHVGISNRPIAIKGTLDGIPDIRDMSSDAALLVAFIEERIPDHDVRDALPVTPHMRFADLGDANKDDTPGVGWRYTTWYADDRASVSIYLLVGTDPAYDWHGCGRSNEQ